MSSNKESLSLLLYALAAASSRKDRERVLNSSFRKLDGAFRVELNMTAAAEATGTSLSHISKIMNHRQRPSLTMARKLSRYIGVTTDEFLDALGYNGTETLRKKYGEGKKKRGSKGGSRHGNTDESATEGATGVARD